MAMELNQQDNRLVVNGFLKDKNLDHRNFNGSDTIMGTVDVAFKDGEKHNVQRLNVFASQYTKAGNENPSYKSLSKVDTDYNAGGKDADRVHATGRLDYNMFKTRNGDLVKTLRKNAAFFTRIGKDDKKYKNEARAHVVLSVRGYLDKMINNKLTKIVKNVNVGYGNRVNVIPNLKFNPESLGDDVDTIISTFPAGSTIDTQIIFNDYAVVQQTKQQAHGFGHHEQMGTATKFVHNALIDFIKGTPVQGKQALSKDQIKHAKELLDQREAELQGGATKPKAAPKGFGNAPKSDKNPFASGKNAGSKKPISDDDVPF